MLFNIIFRKCPAVRLASIQCPVPSSKFPVKFLDNQSFNSLEGEKKMNTISFCIFKDNIPNEKSKKRKSRNMICFFIV